MEPQTQPVETPKPEKQCKCKPTIILLTILAILALGFAGFEFWQNLKKNDEIALKNNEIGNLRAEIQKLSTSVTPTVNPTQDTEPSQNVIYLKEGDKISFYNKNISEFIEAGTQKIFCGQGGKICYIDGVEQADIAEQAIASYQCTSTDCLVSEFTEAEEYTDYGLIPLIDGEKQIIFDVSNNKVAYEGDVDWVRACLPTEICLYQEIYKYIPEE